MSASHRAIAHAEYGMNVEARLAVIACRNLADRTRHLAVFQDRDPAIVGFFEVEPARPFEGR